MIAERDTAISNEVMNDDTLIDFYCPACGEYNQVQWQWYDVLAPGGNEDTEVTCPNCGKRWRIEIAFMEIDDDIQSP